VENIGTIQAHLDSSGLKVRDQTKQQPKGDQIKASSSEGPRSRAARWPALARLALSAKQKADRLSGVGGSDANIILSGDHGKIRDLWLEKRGERPPADLNGKLNVMLGSWTEHFNRQWYERLTGNRVERVGLSFVSHTEPWRRCTLDGFIESSEAIWEAKHTSAFTTPEQLLERYMPQLQHNMSVLGADRAILSAIFGNHKFEIIEIGADWLYQDELLDAERRFWESVGSGEPPIVVDPPSPPRPLGTREVCLEGNNAWAAAAADWLKHKDAAKTHAAACASIKELVEQDVTRAFGHGIEAKRSKAGALSIRAFAA
jgi:predicted phage-related endonuclease